MLDVQLTLWFEKHFDEQITRQILTPDASLRRYYRLNTNPSTIFMDASLDNKNEEFLKVADLLSSHHLRTPKILAADLDKGYFHIEDFGDVKLIDAVQEGNTLLYLKKAIDTLVQIQTIPSDDFSINPNFLDHDLLYEWNLFTEIFLKKYLNIEIALSESQFLSDTYTWIKNTLLQQPQVIMHRDFHSKNLMLLDDKSLGVLDFQDLTVGPKTYDLVSLLKDCYWTYPDDIIDSAINYYLLASDCQMNKQEFMFYFDITGLQRHLKVLGIFSNLYLAQQNERYLQYFERIFNYIFTVCQKYPELATLHHFAQKYFFR